jgi:hypothetical protein
VKLDEGLTPGYPADILAYGGIMLLWMTMLSACTNSGLGVNNTADTGPTTVDCPWEGTWELTIVECGSFPYSDWFPTYTDSTLEISTASDGGCNAVFTWSGSECAEEEQWKITPDYPELTENQETSTVFWFGDTTVSYQGISNCSPDACLFDMKDMDVVDQPCEEGDRVVSQKVNVNTDIDNQLEIKGLFGDPGRTDCPLDLNTVWVKK